MTLKRGPNATSMARRFRNPRTESVAIERGRTASDAHGHHDREKISVLSFFRCAAGPKHGRIELAAEAERDFVVRQRTEDVQEVLGVETDGDVGASVVDRQLVEA